MASRTDMLIEADRRGLLKGEQKRMFDEAVSRGLITISPQDMSNENLEVESSQTRIMTPEQAGDFARRAQATVDYGGPDGYLDAFGQGAVRGMEKIGEGIGQRYLDVKEFFGGDTASDRRDLEVSRKIQQQKYKPTQDEYPITSTAGDIAGSIVALPIPAARVRDAMAVGGTIGAGTYLEPGEGAAEFAKNIAVDSALSGLGQLAAPYLQKGFNKGQAFFSALYKKVVGADPRPEMFTRNGLSSEGRRAIDELGITEEEFSRIYQELDKSLDPTQAARQSRAEEAGIPLTQAQITRDFEQQQAEQALKSGLGRDANEARAFEQGQQDSIRESMEGFQQQFGDANLGRETRGREVQEAFIKNKKEQDDNVRELYKKAKEIQGDDTILDNNSIVDSAYENLIGSGRPVEDGVIKSVETALAKYGLLGDVAESSGRFRTVVTDDGRRIQILGDIEPLTLNNSELLRQKLNEAYRLDKSGAVKGIIKELDDQVENAVSRLPSGSRKQEAFEKARLAARDVKQQFGQKDIISNLVGYKKGTTTNAIDPADVMAKIYKGDKGITNLKQVKAALMSNPNNRSLDAWKSIQAQGVSDIFTQAFNPANGNVSGQRLKSAIKRFGNGDMKQGERKLKLLLGDKYKQFNSLVQSIGDATIPLERTTNPSGTGAAIINFLVRIGNVGKFGLGDTALMLTQKAKDAAAAKSTLRGIKEASPEKYRKAIKANNDLIDAFIGLGVSRAGQGE